MGTRAILWPTNIMLMTDEGIGPLIVSGIGVIFLLNRKLVSFCVRKPNSLPHAE